MAKPDAPLKELAGTQVGPELLVSVAGRVGRIAEAGMFLSNDLRLAPTHGCAEVVIGGKHCAVEAQLDDGKGAIQCLSCSGMFCESGFEF